MKLLGRIFCIWPAFRRYPWNDGEEAGGVMTQVPAATRGRQGRVVAAKRLVATVPTTKAKTVVVRGGDQQGGLCTNKFLASASEFALVLSG